MPAGRSSQRLRWALLLTGVAAVCLVAFTGWQALQAKDSLELVAEDFQVLSDELTSGDQAAAQATLARAQGHADEARSNTRGPGWWLTSKLPGVGRNITAVRTVADVVDALASDVLPSVVEATATLKPENLRPSNGRVDLAPIVDVAPDVVEADRLLQLEAAKVAALRPGRLAPQIASPVRTLQDKLGEAARLSDRASRAVRLLPPMLGAEGPRSYLMLFQNNAELRATGGIPGSFAVVNARDGKVSLGRQGDAQTVGRFETPPIPLTADERALFGENLGRYPQDVNFTPDFPRSAQLIRAMWNAKHGLQVDGVVSTDPVALSYLLRGTGPLQLGAGQSLTADNAVRMLLSDVYAAIPDPAAQNVYFNAVAAQVFKAVSGGQGDPETVLKGLSQGAGERRILLWSADEDEQALIAPTPLSGELAREAGPAPRVGIFLNDATGAKMDYYLDHEVTVEPARCQGDRQILDVEVTLRSTAPEGGVGLPDYVAESVVGVARGTIRTTFYAYAPIGGYVDEGYLDDEELPLTRREHGGRSLVSTTVDVEPGETRVLRFVMVSGVGQTDQPLLRVTPGALGSGVGVVGKPAC